MRIDRCSTAILLVSLTSCLAFTNQTELKLVESTPEALLPPGTASLPVLDLIGALSTNEVVASSSEVEVIRGPDRKAGLVVAIKPGRDMYPGVTLNAPGANWDLSAFGHVEARCVNTGTNRLNLSLRVDNAGPWQGKPWSTESVAIKAGATGTVRVCFGYSYGKAAYALNPAAVVRVTLFTGTSPGPQSFRIESLEAGGKPGEVPPKDPNAVRFLPKEGLLLGPGVSLDASTQFVTRGAKASVVKHDGVQTWQVNFAPSPRGEAIAQYKPVIGRWDLRDALEVRVTLKNEGTNPVTPRLRLESNGGTSDWAELPAPLAPGAAAEVVVPFIPAVPWTVLPAVANVAHLDARPGTGTKLLSDAVSAITLVGGTSDVERVVTVTSIRAGIPPAPAMPDWLGKRPPVAGDWTMTFNDEFDGSAIDTNRWTVYGNNWYDKVSHYSKDNVIVGDGVARLRYEKKRGFHNDDPRYTAWAPAVTGETEYATGFLDTYDRWTQRYGYFESRLKLPQAPGLWPAFWMMPDRGSAFGAASKRGATADGGMEFDIMEWLSRWGRYRFNIAMHWDGYAKDHKSCGTGTIYVQPDKDGYLTCGLLWTPGAAVYYCNGREVLRWEDPRVSTIPAHIIFTMPCGGWDNDQVDDAKLPADFIVDYVRVWQRKDLQ